MCVWEKERGDWGFTRRRRGRRRRWRQRYRWRKRCMVISWRARVTMSLIFPTLRTLTFFSIFFFFGFFLWWVLIWFDNMKSDRGERELQHVLSAARDLFGGFWIIRPYWNGDALNSQAFKIWILPWVDENILILTFIYCHWCPIYLYG